MAHVIRAASETTATGGYVHGYRRCEQERLDDQAGALVELLHAGTAYPPGSVVLEVGCGVGSQTVTLARRSPNARFVSVDVSAGSVSLARWRVADAGLTNVGLFQADLFALPFRPASFDHAFICFVLEHLSRPREALEIVRELLRPGGTVTVVEGDHGSAFFHPDSEAARAVNACQVELQQRAGGDALIGRRLYPLLADAGYASAEVTPRNVYVDASRPDLVEGFTRRTFTAMIEGVRDQAIATQLSSPDRFDAGIRDLHRTAEADGVFSYTFFKATATTPGPVGSPGDRLA
jgi:SAM-dependent methyltransferase